MQLRTTHDDGECWTNAPPRPEQVPPGALIQGRLSGHRWRTMDSETWFGGPQRNGPQQQLADVFNMSRL